MEFNDLNVSELSYNNNDNFPKVDANYHTLINGK
jgi:hypothetical protein